MRPIIGPSAKSLSAVFIRSCNANALYKKSADTGAFFMKNDFKRKQGKRLKLSF